MPLSPKMYRERFGDKDLDKLKEAARVPFKPKTTDNYYTNWLKTAAGIK